MNHNDLFKARHGARHFSLRLNFLLALMLFVMPPASQAGLMQSLFVANQSRTINSALAQGKSVLIAHKTLFNPATDIGESPSVMGGQYRPPLTYWLHRETKQTLVLGGYSTEEGRGKLLTNDYFFFILEPGMYDLVGFVKKTRRMGSLTGLVKATSPIRSALGFVNFSAATLPALQAYTAWVPAQAAGSTFDGHMITQWYDPGYYEERVGLIADDAILIDMRGLAPYSAEGEATVATFGMMPGQISVVGDFQLDFTHGNCDVPAKEQWICPLESLTLSMPFSPQQDAAQASMNAVGYKAALVGKVDSAMLVPGVFFDRNNMKVAPGLRTTRGDAYAQFRVTSTTLQQAARRKK